MNALTSFLPKRYIYKFPSLKGFAITNHKKKGNTDLQYYSFHVVLHMISLAITLIGNLILTIPNVVVGIDYSHGIWIKYQLGFLFYN